MTDVLDIPDIPHHLKCPITLELMKDPVLCQDGYTYERMAIEEYLKKNPISPITRQPIDQTRLIPNRNLKNAIESFIKDNGLSVIKQIKDMDEKPEYKMKKIELKKKNEIVTRKGIILLLISVLILLVFIKVCENKYKQENIIEMNESENKQEKEYDEQLYGVKNNGEIIELEQKLLKKPEGFDREIIELEQKLKKECDDKQEFDNVNREKINIYQIRKKINMWTKKPW
jgi:hypothetical protein